MIYKIWDKYYDSETDTYYTVGWEQSLPKRIGGVVIVDSPSIFGRRRVKVIHMSDFTGAQEYVNKVLQRNEETAE